MKAQTSDQILIAMKWMLENIGWTQDAYYRDTTDRSMSVDPSFHENVKDVKSMCLVGASRLVQVENGASLSDAWKRLERAAGTFYLVGFNDYPGRTKQEMIDLLDRALQNKGRYT